MNNKKNSNSNANNQLKSAWYQEAITKNQLDRIKGGIHGKVS